jgi:CRP-like cAMP-binding protein
MLHVLEDAKAGELVVPQDLLESSTRRLANMVPAEAELWCEPDYIDERGEVAEKILDVAKNRKADLIVLGTILVIQKQEMIRVLYAERTLSERFIKHMLSRNIQVEEDLIDQLFKSSEKRLARTLLLLAHYGKQDKPEKMVPDVSQEMLAEMIGTTRSRVNFFMNKFRKRGLIEYGSKLRGLRINKSLLDVVLHD